MKKRTLRDTNAYLMDPTKARELVLKSVATSSAIEGIRIPLEEMRSWVASSSILGGVAKLPDR